ncbi:hypothetical protein BOTBODRAFT_168688 [Botryobasidium botryosum FD-172 SS1]|uniref:TPR-like protein n=1 Tax=Botryobasidium botryosum (strain FD-172 SS1) TaxID=930990 RepID=A0A067N394_BOTB1|nr:hypothetical protein BOTBODRAFT_168688 [Botryobasidium botryosum FD-172 SS1]
MGRTKTRQKGSITVTSSTKISSSSTAPTPAALLAKAQDLITQYDYDLAQRFIQRALEQEPENGEAREMLGFVELERGKIEAARQIFTSLVPPSPTALKNPPPAIYLSLAQLTDSDPHSALDFYQTAVDMLSVQLKGKARLNDANDGEEIEARKLVVQALVGMNCDNLLNLALQMDPQNAEALQSLASVRMSQSRPEEAKETVERAWAIWKDLDPGIPLSISLEAKRRWLPLEPIDDPLVPLIPSRLSLTRLFLELSLFAPALLVLQGILATDDQEMEAWYLEGWCFFLMGERAREGGTTIDGLGWKELMRDARDCLEACQTLHTAQCHPDEQLLQHVHELLSELDNAGIVAMPEAGQDAGGTADSDDWEDVDEEEDGDVEMG